MLACVESDSVILKCQLQYRPMSIRHEGLMKSWSFLAKLQVCVVLSTPSLRGKLLKAFFINSQLARLPVLTKLEVSANSALV